MNFSFSLSDMNYGMGMVTRAIAPRSIRQIYECVMIETPEEGGLLLTCTNGMITISAHVDADIQEDGVAAIPAKLFAELLRRQSDQTATVTIDPRTWKSRIKSGKALSTIACMPADDFPEVMDISGTAITLPSNQLRDAISRVLFAVSSDETRKILTGVLMEIRADEIRFVGLDGFRLALQAISVDYPLPAGKEKICAIVPGEVMTEISRMLPDDKDIPVRVVFNESHIMVQFGSVKLYSTLLTGEYIDYNRIMPAETQTKIIVGRQLFSNAIDRCCLMAREGKSNLIYLTISEGKMALRAYAECGEVNDEIDIGTEEGAQLKIAFNAKYLTDVLRNIGEDSFKMCFNTPVSPCLVTPVEGNAFKFLLLPVRTFDQ